MSRKVIIMGAAGRDFHVFNCCYRDNAEFDVIAFTATQIPTLMTDVTRLSWRARFTPMVYRSFRRTISQRY